MCLLRGAGIREPRCPFQAHACTPCRRHDGDVRVSDPTLYTHTPRSSGNGRRKTRSQPPHTEVEQPRGLGPQSSRWLGPQLSANTCHANFLTFSVSHLCSPTQASWDHLQNKLPAFKLLSCSCDSEGGSPEERAPRRGWQSTKMARAWVPRGITVPLSLPNGNWPASPSPPLPPG